VRHNRRSGRKHSEARRRRALTKHQRELRNRNEQVRQFRNRLLPEVYFKDNLLRWQGKPVQYDAIQTSRLYFVNPKGTLVVSVNGSKPVPVGSGLSRP